MHLKITLLSILLLTLARWATTPHTLLFYDAPEYLQIATDHPLAEAVRLGHPPVKPVITAFMWGSTRIMQTLFTALLHDSANLAVMITGILSVLLFLILTKHLLSGVHRYQAALLFALFPSVWIISTNLLAESVLLPLYLATLLFTMQYLRTPTKISAAGLVLFIALLIGGHIQMIVWLPTVFALALVAQPKHSPKTLLLLTSIVFFGLMLALISYAIIFFGGERSIPAEMRYQFFGRTGDHYFLADPMRGPLLGIRNFLFTMRGAFGTTAALAFVGVGWMNRKKKHLLIALSLLGVSLVISGSAWTGDFMMRRVVFAAPLLSLLIARSYPRAGWLVLAGIVPVTVANGLLSLRWQSADMMIPRIIEAQSRLPPDQALITTRYLSPFTYRYQGTILYAGVDDLSRVDTLLKENKRVFLDSSAVTAPYLLPVGNNLHVTSVKTGRSETQTLFSRYTMGIVLVHDPDRFLFFYEIHLPEATQAAKARKPPGTLVAVVSANPMYRLHRARIDYGDPFSWLIAWMRHTHDPLFFTYTDNRGLAVVPLSDATYTLQY